MTNFLKRKENAEVTSASAEEVFDKPVYTPDTDIYEDDENIFVIADIPGVAQKDIEVSLENKVLSFTATQHDRMKEGYERVGSGLSTGVFKRSFKVETDIDVDSISAQCRDGVLQLTLPKAEELKPRQITVKAG